MVIPYRKTTVVLAAVVGVFVGVGLFTFHFAEGFSYFSSDPRACVNCHVMNDQYDSWIKGPHHASAKCVDCHLPHEFVPKMIAKSENGYHHSTAFTLGNFHEPIMIKPRNAQILQEACIRCHGDFVHDITANAKRPADQVRCVHCHRNMGHGARG